MSTLAQPMDPRDEPVPRAGDAVADERARSRGGAGESAPPQGDPGEVVGPRAGAASEREARTQRRLITGLFVGYLVVGGGLTYLRGGSFLTPEKFGILLLGGALVLGQGKAFVRDWAPFLLLLFGYELMRGVADNVADIGSLSREDHGRVLVQGLIDAEKLLFFGRLPTIWLQDRLYVEGTTHWYDALAALVYMFHFVLPLAFGFLLWARDRRLFRRFTMTLLATSYGAFVFFLLVPAAPPWLAEQWGYVDGVGRPSYQAYKLFLPQRFADVDTFRLWTQASPNPVAALPSLHAAFPWLVLLFAVQAFGRWGWLALVYNVALWFSVVYLSQHWFVDVLAGMAWATACWWGVGRLTGSAFDVRRSTFGAPGGWSAGRDEAGKVAVAPSAGVVAGTGQNGGGPSESGGRER